jgi:hypothetical protein
LDFLFFYTVRYSTLLHLPPLRFHTVSEDSGIELRTVAPLALTEAPGCSIPVYWFARGGERHFSLELPDLRVFLHQHASQALQLPAQ